MQHNTHSKFVDKEEFWNKNQLAFFLAVQNLQLKTANKIYKKYEFLRKIIYKRIQAYTISREIRDRNKLSINLNKLINEIENEEREL